MAYILSCLQELLPFGNAVFPIYTSLAIAGASVSHGHISSSLSVMRPEAIASNDIS